MKISMIILVTLLSASGCIRPEKPLSKDNSSVVDKTGVNKTPLDINALIWEMAKDGIFSKTDAEAVALEVARRLWWPESTKIVVVDSTENEGTWTINVQNRKGTPADPGCQIIVSKHWLVSTKFIPGE